MLELQNHTKIVQHKYQTHTILLKKISYQTFKINNNWEVNSNRDLMLLSSFLLQLKYSPNSLLLHKLLAVFGQLNLSKMFVRFLYRIQIEKERKQNDIWERYEETMKDCRVQRKVMGEKNEMKVHT